MKIIQLTTFAIFLAIFSISGITNVQAAISFDLINDYNDPLLHDSNAMGGQYKFVDDKNILNGVFTFIDPHPLAIEFDLNFVPPPDSVDSATFEIAHRGHNTALSGRRRPTRKEIWVLDILTGGTTSLGQLSESGSDPFSGDWVVDSFSISSSVLASLASENYILALEFYEETTGPFGLDFLDYDTISLDYTRLHGEYTAQAQQGENPIPEPTTMALVGFGLAGVALRRKKK